MDNTMKERLRKDVASALGIDETMVVTGTNRKNNGTMKEYISVLNRESGVTACCYLDQFEESLNNGTLSYELLVGRIAALYTDETAEGIQADTIRDATGKDYVMSNCFLQLINAENNSDLLEEVPHMMLLDLAMVARVRVDADSTCQKTYMVTNRVMQHIGIDRDTLLDAAYSNTIRSSGFKITTMAKMLAEMLNMPEDMYTAIWCEEPEIYVCTNTSKLNGAAILLKEEMFHELAEKLQTDLYILPSSIHEVLALPVSDGSTAEEMRRMVRDVNRIEVAPEEVLSNNVYVYSLKERKLSIA